MRAYACRENRACVCNASMTTGCARVCVTLSGVHSHVRTRAFSREGVRMWSARPTLEWFAQHAKHANKPLAYVLDKDGTLVVEGRAVAGAKEFLDCVISSHKIPCVILSNTGERSGALAAKGLCDALDADEIPTVFTAYDHMMTLASDLLADESAMVKRIGGGVAPHIKPLTKADRIPFDEQDSCAEPRHPRRYILCLSDGMIEDFCETVTTVANWIECGNASLWMTSADASLLGENDAKRPGPGVFLAALELTLGRSLCDSELRVVGKGGREKTFEYSAMRMLREQGFRGPDDRVMVVGDRYDTDIRAGAALGWTTCLVESGCHTVKFHNAMYPRDVADMAAGSISDLIAHAPASSTTQDVLVELVRDVVQLALRKTPFRRNVVAWLKHRIDQIPSSLHGVTVPTRARSHPVRLCELDAEEHGR